MSIEKSLRPQKFDCPILLEQSEKPGYHLSEIPRGVVGESSKILEETLELQDAERQGAKIMALVELSDLVGAIELYLRNRHPHVTMEDLLTMARITRRAFENGRRS